jgi:hypothetical protein
MNQPFGPCQTSAHHFHAQIADLATDLQKYGSGRHRRPPSPSLSSENMDDDSDALDLHDVSNSFMNVDEPLEDDGPRPYVERYEEAAKTYGPGASFMQQFDSDEFAEIRVQNIYYPFASQAEWELATFLLESDLSMAQIDKFLSLKHVSALLQDLFHGSDISEDSSVEIILFHSKEATQPR